MHLGLEARVELLLLQVKYDELESASLGFEVADLLLLRTYELCHLLHVLFLQLLVHFHRFKVAMDSCFLLLGTGPLRSRLLVALLKLHDMIFLCRDMVLCPVQLSL